VLSALKSSPDTTNPHTDNRTTTFVTLPHGIAQDARNQRGSVTRSSHHVNADTVTDNAKCRHTIAYQPAAFQLLFELCCTALPEQPLSFCIRYQRTVLNSAGGFSLPSPMKRNMPFTVYWCADRWQARQRDDDNGQG
jgi:hypothetical protein